MAPKNRGENGGSGSHAAQKHTRSSKSRGNNKRTMPQNGNEAWGNPKAKPSKPKGSRVNPSADQTPATISNSTHTKMFTPSDRQKTRKSHEDPKSGAKPISNSTPTKTSIYSDKQTGKSHEDLKLGSNSTHTKTSTYSIKQKAGKSHEDPKPVAKTISNSTPTKTSTYSDKQKTGKSHEDLKLGSNSTHTKTSTYSIKQKAGKSHEDPKPVAKTISNSTPTKTSTYSDKQKKGKYHEDPKPGAKHISNSTHTKTSTHSDTQKAYNDLQCAIGYNYNEEVTVKEIKWRASKLAGTYIKMYVLINGEYTKEKTKTEVKAGESGQMRSYVNELTGHCNEKDIIHATLILSEWTKCKVKNNKPVRRVCIRLQKMEKGKFYKGTYPLKACTKEDVKTEDEYFVKLVTSEVIHEESTTHSNLPHDQIRKTHPENGPNHIPHPPEGQPKIPTRSARGSKKYHSLNDSPVFEDVFHTPHPPTQQPGYSARPQRRSSGRPNLTQNMVSKGNDNMRPLLEIHLEKQRSAGSFLEHNNHITHALQKSYLKTRNHAVSAEFTVDNNSEGRNPHNPHITPDDNPEGCDQGNTGQHKSSVDDNSEGCNQGSSIPPELLADDNPEGSDPHNNVQPEFKPKDNPEGYNQGNTVSSKLLADDNQEGSDPHQNVQPEFTPDDNHERCNQSNTGQPKSSDDDNPEGCNQGSTIQPESTADENPEGWNQCCTVQPESTADENPERCNQGSTVQPESTADDNLEGCNQGSTVQHESTADDNPERCNQDSTVQTESTADDNPEGCNQGSTVQPESTADDKLEGCNQGSTVPPESTADEKLEGCIQGSTVQSESTADDNPEGWNQGSTVQPKSTADDKPEGNDLHNIVQSEFLPDDNPEGRTQGSIVQPESTADDNPERCNQGSTIQSESTAGDNIKGCDQGCTVQFKSSTDDNPEGCDQYNNVEPEIMTDNNPEESDPHTNVQPGFTPDDNPERCNKNISIHLESAADDNPERDDHNNTVHLESAADDNPERDDQNNTVHLESAADDNPEGCNQASTVQLESTTEDNPEGCIQYATVHQESASDGNEQHKNNARGNDISAVVFVIRYILYLLFNAYLKELFTHVCLLFHLSTSDTNANRSSKMENNTSLSSISVITDDEDEPNYRRTNKAKQKNKNNKTHSEINGSSPTRQADIPVKQVDERRDSSRKRPHHSKNESTKQQGHCLWTGSNTPDRHDNQNDIIQGLTPKYPVHRTGIPNLGNTCYANSVLQVLGKTPLLWTRLQTTRNLRGSALLLQKILAELNNYNSTHCVNDAIVYDLLRSVFKRDDSFRIGTQNDSHAFLLSLLNCVQADSDEDPCQVFEGMMMSRFEYKNTCSHVEYSDEQSFTSLLMPITNTENVQACIEAFCRVEEFEKNLLQCRVCKTKQQGTVATKRIVFTKLPEIVVLQMGRFEEYMEYSSKKKIRKKTARIKFSNEIELDSEKQEPSAGSDTIMTYSYNLYGVVNHHGSIGGGHYTASVRVENTNDWYHCSDSHVSPGSNPTANPNGEAYLLFYRRNEATMTAVSHV